MSTHRTRCAVCEEDVYCSSPVHALGVGGLQGEGGCENPPYIEFCSVECFVELERRLAENRKRLEKEDPKFLPPRAAV